MRRSQEGDSDHDLLLLQRAVSPDLDKVRLAAPVQKPSPVAYPSRAREATVYRLRGNLSPSPAPSRQWFICACPSPPGFCRDASL